MRDSTLPVVFISAGSNIDPQTNLQRAVDALSEHCNLLAVSSVYRSPPFGYKEQPDFLDIIVKLSTPSLPIAFKDILDEIEADCGRDRDNQESPYGPLPLDMDILLWGESAFSFGKKPWRVPHPSILEEAAVAIPLAELAGDIVHPLENVTIREIADRFKDSDGVTRTDLTIG